MSNIPRLKPDREDTDLIRKQLLGNSVVPDAVRYAFLYLASRFTKVPSNLDVPRDFEIVQNDTTKKKSYTKVKRGESWPPAGIVDITGHLMKAKRIPHLDNPWKFNKILTFDPSKFKSKKPMSPKLSTEILKGPVEKHLWATPRHSNMRPSNYLTSRCIKDLPTQVRFERGTKGRRDGYVTPEFVEYLMGYEIGWTSS